MTILIRDEEYDLQMEIKDPDLVRRYQDNPDEFTEYVRAHITLALADLTAPDHIRPLLNRLSMEYGQKKFNLMRKMQGELPDDTGGF